MTKNKAVFIDRDGVINEVLTKRVKFVNKPNDLFYLDKVPEAIGLLSSADYLIFVVTNQGGVGLGYMTEEQLEKIHKKMKIDLESEGGEIQDIASCIHKPNEGCSCRKPEAGMILKLAEQYKIDIDKSYMIGDRDVDIEAGRKAGCSTIFIGKEDNTVDANFSFPTLYAAANWLKSTSNL
ncbi:D-glycero-D-manno-heptose 1,7-bisphosphate phosphatase [Bacillus pakistanensis]|uniref:D,D-heptose 1,7-bisphosphate phosphatase n=1 Tax=Rossellomorea pakistanensis TaxID=992288 RepID=A0ABS2N8I5_9BACI|nr:HAD family hydrolase [Bacillus pakistanensis]MBM7584074.1 D-glycero-D-manno-heptose 1,7-bisphosphate phosphatase [Bacillus pakistanensis]